MKMKKTRIDQIIESLQSIFDIKHIDKRYRNFIYALVKQCEDEISAELTKGLYDQGQEIRNLKLELRKATAREKQWQVLAGSLASAANSIYCELRVRPMSTPTPNGIERADDLHAFVVRHLELDENE